MTQRDNLDDPVLALLREILEGQSEILAALADTRPLRDAPPLLRELAAFYGDQEWTAAELAVDAEEDADLPAAVAAVGGVRCLGASLRDLCDQSYGGLRLTITRQNRRNVAVWCVTDIPPATPRTSFDEK